MPVKVMRPPMVTGRRAMKTKIVHDDAAGIGFFAACSYAVPVSICLWIVLIYVIRSAFHLIWS